MPFPSPRNPGDQQTRDEASQAVRAMIGTIRCEPGIRTPHRSRAYLPTAIASGCMTGLRWSDAEVSALTEMAGKVKPMVIAAQLKRSIGAARYKAGMLGLRLSLPPQTRSPRIVPDAERSRRIFVGCYPSMRSIIMAMSEKHGMPVENILSQSRVRATVLARREMIWTIARDTTISGLEIGRRLKLDHTTILHAVRRQNDATGENVRGCGGVRPQKRQARERFFAKRRAAK